MRIENPLNTLNKPFFGVKLPASYTNFLQRSKLATSSPLFSSTNYSFLLTHNSYLNHNPFGMLMPDRNGSQDKYRYGFQGQEKDDEIKGEGNSLNFEYRMHDPRIGRFFAVDPLANEFAYNSPFAFCENRVLDAIELEGLEAFFIHGTSADNTRLDNYPETIRILKGLSASSKQNTSFYWSNNYFWNNQKHRKAAAKNLAEYVIINRKQGDVITLIGHSHGGNVAIQAAELIFKATGERVNLITVSTPVTQSLLENPQRYSRYIFQHTHLYTELDQVQTSLASIFSGPSSRTYNNQFTLNVRISKPTSPEEGDQGKWGPFDSHSFDQYNPQVIEKLRIPQQQRPDSGVSPKSQRWNISKIIPSAKKSSRRKTISYVKF